jgi:hypothetical protein
VILFGEKAALFPENETDYFLSIILCVFCSATKEKGFQTKNEICRKFKHKASELNYVLILFCFAE